MIFDVPRITESVRDSLTSQESSVIYNLTKKRFEYYDGTNWCPFNFGTESGEPTGFPINSSGEVDRTSSVISFDNESRTFSIAPASDSFIFMIKGKLFKKTTAQTQTITDTEGLWYFYFDETGVLQKTQTFSNDIILKHTYVAYVYWDADSKTAIHIADERHGLTMDSHDHIWKHSAHGAAYISGLALGDFDIGDGSLASHAQLSVTSGYIRDEDILHTIPSVTSTTGLRVFYRSGSNDNWRRGFQSGYPILTLNGTGRIVYNQYTGGTWQQTEVDNNKFVCYHILSTNDIAYPTFAVMGQAQYDTKAEARAGANNEISNLAGLPFYEFRFIGTVIYQTADAYTNTVNSRIVLTDTGANYVDWRFSAVQPTTASVNMHNNLGGLNVSPYYHSNQPIDTTDSVQFAGLTLAGDIITTGNSIDFDLIDNNASALSFDTTGKSGILEIVTTDGSEKVNMSGNLEVAGTVTTNDTIININNAAPTSAPTKDIGIEFKYYDTKTSTMRTGFIGGITSSNVALNGLDYFVLLNDTTNTNDKITGTLGDLKVGNIDSAYYAYLNNVIISGDLTVNGTTTNINTMNLVVEDKNIIIADVDTPTNTTANGAGITIKGATDKTFNWVNTTTAFTSSEHIDLASGKSYHINGSVVLSATQVLGKSMPTGTIVGTSDEQTLTNKTLQSFTITGDISSISTAIDFDLIDNNASALSFDTTGKAGILEIVTTDGAEKVNMSGGLDVTGTTILKGLTYPTTDGTNGQAIVTDGSGVLSFATIVGGGGAGLTYQITATPPVTLKVGMPVYWNGTAYAPANANTNTKIPTAIVKEINVGDYTVQFGGTLTLTNTQWDQITGGSGGLSTSTTTNTYYLSDVNDGEITNVSPIFSIPLLNCVKNDSTNSTVEIKFGTLASTLTNESYAREREIFTGNGSTNTFTVTLTPHSRNTTMVTIDGVVQQGDAFSISNKNIVFSGAPPANSEIEVNYVTQKNLSYANITRHVETTEASKAAFTLPVTPTSESEVMAWIGGSYQDASNFTLSGNILTFDTNVDSGVKVQFVIFSSIQFSDFPFIKRKSVTITNSGTKTIIDAFGSQASGRYDFHVISNPLISGTVRIQEMSPLNVRVETFSSDVTSVAATSNKLNVYLNGNDNLEFQNLLGSSIILMLERHQ